MRHASGRRRRTLLAGAVAALVVVAAAVAAWFLWSPGAGAARGVEVMPVLEPATLSVAPGDVVTLAGGGVTDASFQLSQALWSSAPVVALATEDTLTEVSAATAGLSLPLLVVPGDPGEEDTARLASELERLGTRAVTHAGVTLPAGIDVEHLRASHLKRPGDAGVTPHLLVGDAATRDLAEAVLSPVKGAADIAAEDPRGAVDVIRAIAEDPEAALVVMGDFADEDYRWKLETVLTGVELPGGGQLAAPGKLYVALYGHPGSSALGVLGEQGVEATIERARAHAAPYEALTDMTVVPSLEIIATIASAGAGPDGNYSAEAEIATLRPLVDAAAENGLYVVLDLQPGRTDFLTQAKLYEELLREPHVGLALDPEWRLKPNQVHLRQIGSVAIDEVNEVANWLADLTREHLLPQKVLILHSFRISMTPDIDRLDTSRDELAIVMHVDGQGAQGAKQETWRALHDYAPNMPFWGWKNFYDEDSPAMLTPEQTMANVSPTPVFVSYQ